MRYTTRQTTKIVGCTARQLDQIVRTGIMIPIEPPCGPGSRMRFDADDVRVLTVLVALRRLGATRATLQPLAHRLRALPEDGWHEPYAVTEDGQLVGLGGRLLAGWLVDLRLVHGAERVAA